MPAQSSATRYAHALRLAALVHAGQTWKGTPVPYLTHVVSVSRILEHDGQAEPLVLAGLLHDTLEDVIDTPDLRARLSAVFPEVAAQEGRDALIEAVASAIASRFGPEVRRLVEAVTANPAAADETPALRRARREQQLAHLHEAPDHVVLLKAADTQANVSALTDALATPPLAAAVRAHAPVDELVWYYGAVADVVAGRLGTAHALTRALAVAYDALQHAARPQERR